MLPASTPLSLHATLWPLKHPPSCVTGASTSCNTVTFYQPICTCVVV